MINFLKRKDKQRVSLTPAKQTAKPEALDWRKSRAHAKLLTCFVRPRDVSKKGQFTEWTEPLGESAEAAIRRFVDLDLLREVDNVAVLVILYSLADLKRFSKERELAQSGTKEVLARRLADSEGTVDLLSGHRVLVCTEQGTAIAETYEQSEAERKRDALDLSRQHLLAGNYRQAVLTMASYEADCVFKRGINISWSNYDPSRDERLLRYIFTSKPKALIERGWDKLGDVSISAGMMHLRGSAESASITLGDLGVAAARILMSHAHYRCELDNSRASGVKHVHVYTCNDDSVCPACRKLATKQKIRLEDVPEFPLVDCTNEDGCRCWIVACPRLD